MRQKKLLFTYFMNAKLQKDAKSIPPIHIHVYTTTVLRLFIDTKSSSHCHASVFQMWIKRQPSNILVTSRSALPQRTLYSWTLCMIYQLPFNQVASLLTEIRYFCLRNTKSKKGGILRRLQQEREKIDVTCLRAGFLISIGMDWFNLWSHLTKV